MENTISFTQDAKPFILDIFNKSIDKEGFVVEKDNPQKRVIALDGETVKAKELAAIKKGSLVFVKSDVISLVELADTIK
ncbi:MAG: hypothetical protein WCV91_05630 [Candidatus Margulisiibacteriota bacterium]|jgi:hypothetical protein